MLLHHCSNFRAWTSVSSNSWNAQRQGGLSSDSSSSQPSWLRPSDPDTWSPSLSGPDGIFHRARHSLNPGSQETGPYVKIGCASWRLCCSPGFWKHSACCWQVLRSFWPYCCQESSSLPEQIPSTLPVPLRSLSFRTLDLWWAAGSEDRQRCQLSTSPWSILEKPGTSKWISLHPCPEPWWTAWLSRAWCAALGRIFCLCPPEGRWWRSFLCKAPIYPAKASPSCNTEHGSYYPTCIENMGTWWSQAVVSTKKSIQINHLCWS